jgi:hypothetical protein
MAGMEWLLEIALIGLLLATMFHAVRLERALGVLKRDRAALEELVAGFNASTRAAEQGIDRLKQAADGAGRQIARQVEAANRLKDDLVFLNERGTTVADRLDHLVRAGRSLDLAASRPAAPSAAAPAPAPLPEPEPEPLPEVPQIDPAGAPRLRSQAERDLMRALGIAR